MHMTGTAISMADHTMLLESTKGHIDSLPNI